jgi:hypothetical protein
MSPVTPRLRDGESFVKGRSTAKAIELLELAEAAGREGSVKTTSLGYVVPTEILSDYSGESITAADQPAVITQPGTTQDRAEATNVEANAGDGRLVEGVESATTPADATDNAELGEGVLPDAPADADADADADGGTEFNPSDATVDEVNEYLEGADEAERTRVLAAEAAGKARKGIIGEEK